MGSGGIPRTCDSGRATFRHLQARAALSRPVDMVNNVAAGNLCITPGLNFLPELRILASHRFTMIIRQYPATPRPALTAGAGVPQPHGPVRVPAIRQPFDGDVGEGAAQHRQVLAAGEPATVAVDEGMHAVPGFGPDGPVERGTRQDEGLVRLRVRGQGLLPAPRPGTRVGLEVLRFQAVHRGAAAGRAAVPALPGERVCVEHAAGGEPDQEAGRAAEEPVRERGGAVRRRRR